MENVKDALANNFKKFISNPVETTLNFAANVLGSAVVIWFASVIVGFAIRIVVSSYHVLSSIF
jgi:hypothetical protein